MGFWLLLWVSFELGGGDFTIVHVEDGGSGLQHWAEEAGCVGVDGGSLEGWQWCAKVDADLLWLEEVDDVDDG